MFHKTSSVDFLKYGEVFTESADVKRIYQSNHTLPVTVHNLVYLYQADHDIYLRCIKGICMIVVSDDINKHDFHNFVIHRIVKINKGIYFNFISLSDKATLELAFAQETIIQNVFLDKPYQYDHILPKLRINELIAYYYNVRGTDYVFAGEKQQFWEFTFVDNGTLYTTIEDKDYEVKNNQCIFYGPDQFHKQSTKGQSCSYLTIIFNMQITDENKHKLINRVFDIDRQTKRALEMFVDEQDNYSNYDKEIMVLSIEKVILSLLRSLEEKGKPVSSTPMQQKFENELLEQILLYINENIYTDYNVEELCNHFAISRSTLQTLFRNNLNIAPKEFISRMKLKKSKELIKESTYTFSEIAAMLGFSSIHYFSRKFKQEFGINPTEYANKII